MGLISDLGNWLDAKFPDKVVVTEVSYLTLKAQVATQSEILAAQDVRIKNLCKELVDLKIDEVRTDLNKLKVAAGFRSLGNQFNNSPLSSIPTIPGLSAKPQ